MPFSGLGGIFGSKTFEQKRSAAGRWRDRIDSVGVGLVTNGNMKGNRVRKRFSGGGRKFGWRIRLIAHLWLLAVVHHWSSSFLLSFAVSDNVDQASQTEAKLHDTELEDNCRISPTIERIRSGIWRSSRPGKSSRIIQHFVLSYAFETGPSPATPWTLVVQAEGSLIVYNDTATPQDPQLPSETSTKEQEAKYPDEHEQCPSQPCHGFGSPEQY